MKSDNKPQSITIDDVEYVRADAQFRPAVNTDGLKYVIIRSRDSGCHAGYLYSQDGSTVELCYARRLWYWSGAATLSELAMNGVKKPDECKFPTKVPVMTVLGVCEIIDASEKAQESIESVPVWKS